MISLNNLIVEYELFINMVKLRVYKTKGNLVMVLFN